MTEYETESQLTCLFMKHILIFKKCTWNKKKSHATAYKPETAATLIIKKMCEEIKSLIIVGSGFFWGGFLVLLSNSCGIAYLFFLKQFGWHSWKTLFA